MLDVESERFDGMVEVLSDGTVDVVPPDWDDGEVDVDPGWSAGKVDVELPGWFEGNVEPELPGCDCVWVPASPGDAAGLCDVPSLVPLLCAVAYPMVPTRAAAARIAVKVLGAFMSYLLVRCPVGARRVRQVMTGHANRLI